MVGSLKSRVAFLVTSNIHKFNEARRVFYEYSIATLMLKKIGVIEVQDDDIEKIAEASAKDAVGKCDLPIIVEDAGLFITALKGFPGPFSSHVYRTIGNDGVLKLMQGLSNRSARFKSVVAFQRPKMNEPLCFIGEVKGKIVKKKRGNQGFGFDPIFQPFNSSTTFAEMSLEEKNQHSHRASAFREFAKWYSTSP